jgi:hypothetical protein
MLRKFFCVVLLALPTGGMLTGQVQGAKRRAMWHRLHAWPALHKAIEKPQKRQPVGSTVCRRKSAL